MPLTAAQKTTLKNAILADPVLNAFPNTDDGNTSMCDLHLNQLASPAFKVWNPRTSPYDVIDAINLSAYTPNDAPDTSALFTNRALVIQTKQMNLQTMVIGREVVNFAKQNVRAGLRDAVIAIPAGVNGAAVNPGGANGAAVMQAGTRDALLIEKIFAAPSQATGGVSAAVMTFEGKIRPSDVSDARNSNG